MKKLALGLVVLLASGSPVLAGKTYQWVDETGQTVYSDKPPRDGSRVREVEIRIPTFQGEAEISTSRSTDVGRGVTIYTTATCGYCRQAKAYLKKRAIPFVEHDVEKSTTGKLDYRRLNGRGVPIILVGNQRMDGFSEPRLATMLKQAGY